MTDPPVQGPYISIQQLVYRCQPGQGIMADKYYALQACHTQHYEIVVLTNQRFSKSCQSNHFVPKRMGWLLLIYDLSCQEYHLFAGASCISSRISFWVLEGTSQQNASRVSSIAKAIPGNVGQPAKKMGKSLINL